VFRLPVTAFWDVCVASQLMIVALLHSLSVRLRLCCSAPLTLSETQAAAPAVQSILLQNTGTQIHSRAPATAIHPPAQLPVRGESLTGQTQHCSLTLLQLASGGRQDRESEGGRTVRVGRVPAREREIFKSFILLKNSSISLSIPFKRFRFNQVDLKCNCVEKHIYQQSHISIIGFKKRFIILYSIMDL